ncbi:MAG: HEAT repeat domain-containing protein [Ignavibacteriaceae bacterium]|mgnify:CR=1 FL=1|nr:HEAT repeat domain-containing protein [Ignavibacteriaceae bacterium]
MANFKTDTSFLEKISIGAIGTKKVYQNLVSQGHNPIELERGSMSYKIWRKIKIKRIRVPDILLVNCGIRIESRAKSKLEITMSHSQADPERGWDFGLKDSDFVALIACFKVGENPVDWEADELVQYISVRDLREAVTRDEIIEVAAKGAQEGFEKRITWPANIAKSNGIITKITDNAIQYSRTSDNRKVTLRLSKQGNNLNPLVEVGENILNNQIISATIPISLIIESPNVNYEFYITNLTSSSLSERYAASKALAYFNNDIVKRNLFEKLQDTDEHIYIKLESAASLVKLGDDRGYTFIESILASEYVQYVLEAVIVLSEIHTERASTILISVLNDESKDSEIRAGAAWGLGEIRNRNTIDALSTTFLGIHENIKIEAARALAKFVENFTPEILSKFKTATDLEKAGLAWSLAKSQSLNLEQLIDALSGTNTREWVSYIIGKQGEEKFINDIEQLRNVDPEVYFAVTVLWKIMSSWVYNLEEY